jgi:hypothetical protein
MANATMWAAIGIVLAGAVGRLHERDIAVAARRSTAMAL